MTDINCGAIIVCVIILVLLLLSEAMQKNKYEGFGSGPAIFIPHNNAVTYDNVNMEPMHVHTVRIAN